MRTLDLCKRNFIESRPTALDDGEAAVADDLTITRCDRDFSTGTDRKGVLDVDMGWED